MGHEKEGLVCIPGPGSSELSRAHKLSTEQMILRPVLVTSSLEDSRAHEIKHPAQIQDCLEQRRINEPHSQQATANEMTS